MLTDRKMHLHGHDFLVLGTSVPNAGFFTAADIPSLNFTNPTRRDVTSKSVARHPSLSWHLRYIYKLPNHPGSSSKKRSTDVPDFRAIIVTPPKGWNVLAFKSDNPGAWLFHCHIAWHASNGLALSFLERASEQKAQITATQLKEYSDNCNAWNSYFNSQTVVSQIDSGLKVRALEIERALTHTL